MGDIREQWAAHDPNRKAAHDSRYGTPLLPPVKVYGVGRSLCSTQVVHLGMGGGGGPGGCRLFYAFGHFEEPPHDIAATSDGLCACELRSLNCSPAYTEDEQFSRFRIQLWYPHAEVLLLGFDINEVATSSAAVETLLHFANEIKESQKAAAAKQKKYAAAVLLLGLGRRDEGSASHEFIREKLCSRCGAADYFEFGWTFKGEHDENCHDGEHCRSAEWVADNHACNTQMRGEFDALLAKCHALGMQARESALRPSRGGKKCIVS